MNPHPDSHPSPQSAGKGRRYWRSLDEYENTPQFQEFLRRAFPSGAAGAQQASRRGFLKVMGASLGLAGVAGCTRWPEEKLAPYAHRPENRKPGVPVSYATAFELGDVAQGLLVTSYDGRPIKIEGNPTHPLNRGAADTLAQASVLEVYDPDRSRGVLQRAEHRGRQGDGPDAQPSATHQPAAWDDFVRDLKKQLPADGAGLAILSEATRSPSVADLRQRLAKALPKLEWYEYEPVSADSVRAGAKLAFGEPLVASLELSQARVVVALDADLFGDGSPQAIKHARDFAAGRQLREGKDESMNRLYVVESLHTITGANADHRRAVRPSQIAPFVGQLAVALGVDATGLPAAGESGVDKPFFNALLADLRLVGPGAVLVAGAGQPAEVHALVAAINAKLGSLGKAVVYYADPQPQRPSHVEALSQLVQGMQGGKVSALLILGGNPVYNAPADLKFAEALKKVPFSVHLGLHLDETSLQCAWHVSRAHYLEAWGDARTYDGTVTVVQPLIEPLFDGKSVVELLSLVAGETPEVPGYEIVRRTFRGLLGSNYSDWKWKKTLADGVVEGTAWKPAAPQVKKLTLTAATFAAPAKTVANGQFELAFYTDGKVYDGRYANNGWLQELPQPMTRLTWDNAALVSPATANLLGVERDAVIEIAAGPDKLRVPVFFLPGVADGVIGLALGYGRSAAGNVGDAVGQNAYPLRTSAACGVRGEVRAERTDQTHRLATVQDHHIIDAVGKAAVQARIPELIKEGTFAEYQHKPALDVDKAPAVSLFDEHQFDGRSEARPESAIPDQNRHRWGMAVDLTGCVGCGSCVVACQAENNIPIVGREQVLHGREMHWIRVDRYFRDTPQAPQAVHQPVLCMHCENAPCESVCPVAATTHSEEGINMMTYNRCLGTRYCSNNCPYKVRRFNFFDYNRGTLKDLYEPNLLREPVSELIKMQKNPEVTVRLRGVMEKCTFCVQRIEHARIAAKREGDRPLADGEVQTACQQACPAQAIVFGDLNDPASRVSKLQQLQRTYGLLDPELHTKPRTQYVAKVRNTAPGLDTEG